MKFYRCNHCKQIITKLNDSGVPVICCGEPMKELVPNTTDAAGEKHVPVVEVNGKDVKDYFSSAEQVQVVNQPLLVTSMGNKYDIVINVTGGGLNGQAAACLHGISRALVQIDPDARTSLKANGYLTRDSRMVERKKYGQRGARRRFQFSKR